MTENQKMQLKSELDHFHGTMHYHKFSILFSRHYLTDGAKHLAEEAGAYWLMDLIASHSINAPFQVWEFCRLAPDRKNSAVVKCTDGNERALKRQYIPYTDFPFDEFTLYCAVSQIRNKKCFVIMLPGEY